jgi:glyoxylase-like metal-dependent hydrolase (beta-lactamase superfamily II)
MSDAAWSRRKFIHRAGSCAAHVTLMAAAAPLWARKSWASEPRYGVVAQEPWGRLEEVADGIWALVSTPLQDRTTLCNGGIISGQRGVIVVESFASDAGSQWMAAEAERLTGRAPSHVVLTHYHGDHSGGLRGSVASGDTQILATTTTRDLILERANDPPRDILERVRVLEQPKPTEIDLGDRSVVVVPRRGHTDSDVSVEVFDPSVVFCGDLVWNGMFPNFMDATPSRLSLDVRLLRRDPDTVYIPGHGSVADDAALQNYMDLLDDVEAAARRAVERGMSFEEAGAAYSVPAELGEWTLFNQGYFAKAIERWMLELGAPTP